MDSDTEDTLPDDWVLPLFSMPETLHGRISQGCGNAVGKVDCLQEWPLVWLSLEIECRAIPSDLLAVIYHLVFESPSSFSSRRCAQATPIVLAIAIE